MRSAISSYISLTKPTIVLLFALTGIVAMVMEGSLMASPLRFWAVALGVALCAGAANSMNMYFDRDIDRVMNRTRKKRAIPLEKLSPIQALIFGAVLAVISTTLLYVFGNFLAAVLGLFTIGFYVGIYTIFLKPRTSYNIVIGGVAGATAPLIGWAAANGEISILAWMLFLLIVLWTPAHFWALAIVLKDDYAKANIPMLPVQKGEARTRLEILIYSIVVVIFTFYPPFVKSGGALYSVTAAVLGALFIFQALVLFVKKSHKEAYKHFGFSILYLLSLFVTLMTGTLLNH